MSLLTKAWDCTRRCLGHLWSAALDGGWSLWYEVTRGVSRLSWWALLGLVWLEGLAVGWWLWAS